jgi:hypothetical protein
MIFKGIKILGDEEFIAQTKKAIELINKKSKSNFKTSLIYLKIIKQTKKSGMIFKKAQFNVGNPTAFYSLEWYASCIVHDTYHYYLNNIKKFKWNSRNAKEHERLCINKQIQFLKKINAPKKLIVHCKKALKTEYWTKEYQKNNIW